MSIKILYLINTTKMGGGNISFVNMIDGLSKYDVEIYIAYPDKKIDDTFYEKTRDIVKEYIYVPLSNQILSNNNSVKQQAKNAIKKFLFINVIKLKIECKKLNEVVNRVNPDLISTNVGVIHSGYEVSMKCDIPHIWHIREYQTKDFNWVILPSKSKFISMLKNSYVVTITNDLLNFFDLEGYPTARCIYNGCFSEKEITYCENKEKYFLSSSRVSEEKNIRQIIDAFTLFDASHPGYSLKIAGFGKLNYIEYLKQYTIEKHIDDKVEFLGYVSDVKPLMDKATALIVASNFEGFGRMTAEAAFRGCLVIGRATGGTKEILEKTGGFLYSGNHIDLCREMEKCIVLSTSDYKQIIEKAQFVAKKNYSIENNVKQMYSLYSNVLGRNE